MKKNLLLVAAVLLACIVLWMLPDRRPPPRRPVPAAPPPAPAPPPRAVRIAPRIVRPRAAPVPAARPPQVAPDYGNGKVTFSPPPGRYPGGVEVRIATNVEGASIRYTLDAADPAPDGTLCEGPLPLSASAVVRAAAFAGDAQKSPAASATYFVGDRSPFGVLPVLSISLAPRAFAEVHLSGELRGREWERPAWLEAFDRAGTPIASTGFGLRLHGGYGRQGGMGTKKSYRLYFRKEYGSARLECPVIPEAAPGGFDAIVLRAGYNDRMRPGRGEYNVKAAYIRDEVIRGLHRDMGCPAAHGSWWQVWIDMEFRGLYNVVERIDGQFMSKYAGGGRWEVINSSSDGGETWRALEDFVASTDLSTTEGYAAAGRAVDIPNFTAYIILNLWAQNLDWPHHNWYAARPKAADGRWFFLSWDAEWGIGLRPWGWRSDAGMALLGNGGGGVIRDLFQALLSNATYRRYLLQEVARHLEGALRSENVLARIARERERIEPVMEAELDEFFRPDALRDWARNVEEMERFAKNRGPVFAGQMRSLVQAFAGGEEAPRGGRTRY